MAGKHQIWSSSKRTRQKANRCWRRQNRERLRQEATEDPDSIAPQSASGVDYKRGDLVHGDAKPFGLTLGDILANARAAEAELNRAVAEEAEVAGGVHEATISPKDLAVTTDEFTRMIARWSQCTLDDFRQVMDDQPEELLLTEYQQFELTPLDYFLNLPDEFRERWVAHLLK